jgi:hypothetical protein
VLKKTVLGAGAAVRVTSSAYRELRLPVLKPAEVKMSVNAARMRPPESPETRMSIGMAFASFRAASAWEASRETSVLRRQASIKQARRHRHPRRVSVLFCTALSFQIQCVRGTDLAP